MILESVRVQNFRSIKDATLHCDRLTALVGSNGSGKSSFLKAIDLFHNSKATVTDKDYHKNNTGNSITISLTFTGLSDEAKDVFSSYVVNDKLTATRMFAWNEDKGTSNSLFYAIQYTNLDFAGITDLNAEHTKQRYDDLRSMKKYQNFPKLNTKKEIDEQLDMWQKNNPDQCDDATPNSDFESTWNKYANRFVEFITVPAVHDASDDASDVRNSTLALLMVTIKQQVKDDPTYQKFRKRVMANRMAVVEKFRKELDDLGRSITGILQQFVIDAKVDLKWSDELPDIDLPKAEVVLEEDGHKSTVGRAGHGSQRAFIMAMLQKIAQMKREKKTEQGGIKSPTLILSIEEPELYQHPTRQRYISTVLDSLTKSTSQKTQIIYTTHSPYFAGLDKLDHVRLLRKTASTARETRNTQVHKIDIHKLLKRMERLGTTRSKEFMEERLKTIMTPWLNEGFFAETIVLVEGISDYAAIMGMSRLKNKKFEASGVSVIPCYGISNIPDLFVVFDELKIPTYAVWDLDNGCSKKHENNRKARCMLQRLFGAKSKSTQIEDNFSCFDNELEDEIKAAMGKVLFDESLNSQKRRFGIEGSESKSALAKPRIMLEVLKQAAAEDKPCTTLERIVKKIDAKVSPRVRLHESLSQVSKRRRKTR